MSFVAEEDSSRDTGGRKSSKSTYYARKNEIARLVAEAQVLKQRLQTLQDQSSHEHQLLREFLQNSVHYNNLSIARAQSLASDFESQRGLPPIGCYIHLTDDLEERQRTLNSLVYPKIHEAASYMLARTQFLDLSRSSRKLETFEGASGDFYVVHFDITPLREASSVRRAFTETLYFMENQEIALTEKLGVLTVRESDFEHGHDANHIRIVSTYSSGLEMESNVATFSQYFEKSELLDRPHALAVTDAIDQDDLFPFQPESRVRKDICAATLITECYPEPKAQPVVTMVRYAFVRIHQSPLFDRQAYARDIREGVPHWCDAMLFCIRERLKWKSEPKI